MSEEFDTVMTVLHLSGVGDPLRSFCATWGDKTGYITNAKYGLISCLDN